MFNDHTLATGQQFAAVDALRWRGRMCRGRGLGVVRDNLLTHQSNQIFNLKTNVNDNYYQ